jgi:3-phenylpropionate/trans-cinnamate dioxygenase ferredoxin subunit
MPSRAGVGVEATIWARPALNNSSHRGDGAHDDDGFVDVCAFSDLPNAGRRAFVIRGINILCVRINDEIAAVINACTHLGLPLEKGRVIGHQISCPAHGACFDLKTGRALTGPAVVPLTVLRVRIDAGRVWVSIPGG